MNRVKNLITIAAFSFLVLGLPAMASAQYGQYDPNARNGGYNNGGYGNGQYGNTSSTIRDLKSRARDFQRQLDRDLDHSRYNGTRREDQMNDLAKQFRAAVDRLNNNGNYNNSGYGNGGYNNGGNNNRNNNGNDELRRVFDSASQIERSIGRSSASFQSQNIWSGIRNDLQTLSRSYGNNNGRGNNNGGWGNNRNTSNRNGLPSWWPF